MKINKIKLKNKEFTGKENLTWICLERGAQRIMAFKKKNGLKCFRCGKPLDKEEVFRDSHNYPVCEDCIREDLDEWDDDAGGYILELLKNKYNQNYKKYLRNIQKCRGCKVWWEKEELIDGMCDNCKTKEIEKELIK